MPIATVSQVTYYQPHLETLDRESLQAHQWERLESLLRRIWPSNRFYRRKWIAAGVRDPREVRSWEDFHALPFTTKDELVQDQAANPPFGSDLTYPMDAYIRLHQTSGTTGKPLRWLDTAESWQWWAHNWSYVYHGAGVGPGDRVFLAFSFGPFIGFWAAYAAARRLGLQAIAGGGLDTDSRLEVIRRTRPTVFLSTPSYALRLAERAAELGLDLRSLGIRKTIHAGEPGANVPSTRRMIEEAFGAKVFDHTGATEVGATGFSCVHQQGTHLIESEFIAEVVDPDTMQPVSTGAVGELVLTNLGRAGMPVIRYRTRDLVRLSAERCACGRTFARMVGGVLGRSDDMITVRGINVFPSAIENVVRAHAQVAEFLIEAYKEKGLDQLRLKVEPVAGLAAEALARLVNALVSDLRNHLALRVEVIPVPPGTLPRYDLKARRLVRLSNGSQLV